MVGVLHCIAVSCSILQYAAVCCSVSEWPLVAGCRVWNKFGRPYRAVRCSVSWWVAVSCSELQCDAVWCSVLQGGKEESSPSSCTSSLQKSSTFPPKNLRISAKEPDNLRNGHDGILDKGRVLVCFSTDVHDDNASRNKWRHFAYLFSMNIASVWMGSDYMECDVECDVDCTNRSTWINVMWFRLCIRWWQKLLTRLRVCIKFKHIM